MYSSAGVSIGTKPKSRKTRRVPVADRVLPMVRQLAAGRDGDAPLVLTECGYRLHASAFKRTLDWSVTVDGRRIHDLRHTAPCLWLARGVDPVTVQTWMGHASIATTNLYLHHLGTAAGKAGLARLNSRGTQGHTRVRVRMTPCRFASDSRCRTLSELITRRWS